MIEAEDNLLGHLFKYDLSSIEDKVNLKVVEKLRNYANNKNKEYYQFVRDTGLSLIDYLFLSHQQGYRGITGLAKEVGINPETLNNIFDYLSLPKLTRGEMNYVRGLEFSLSRILAKMHGKKPMPHGGARLRPDGSRWGRIGRLPYQEGERIVNYYLQLTRNYEKPIESGEKREVIRLVAKTTDHAFETVERYVLYWERDGHLDGTLPPVEQDEGEILSVFGETKNLTKTASETLRSVAGVKKILKKNKIIKN